MLTVFGGGFFLPGFLPGFLAGFLVLIFFAAISFLEAKTTIHEITITTESNLETIGFVLTLLFVYVEL